MFEPRHLVCHDFERGDDLQWPTPHRSPPSIERRLLSKKSENLASKEVRQVIEEGKLIPKKPWQAVEHEKLAEKMIGWPSKKETSSQKMTGKSPKKES